jgi:hypothetical protein
MLAVEARGGVVVAFAMRDRLGDIDVKLHVRVAAVAAGGIVRRRRACRQRDRRQREEREQDGKGLETG